MLIFVQTLKANLKINKNALSLAKRNKIKTKFKKEKPSFQEVFFKSKNKTDFSKVLQILLKTLRPKNKQPKHFASYQLKMGENSTK